MVQYRLINSGNNKRREYITLNKSLLFKNIPEYDFAEEQKRSYNYFLERELSDLFLFYFPSEFSDYNNTIKVDIENLKYIKPEITEDEARDNSQTWSNSIIFSWKFFWNCQKMQINIQEENEKDNIEKWIKESFKIGKFSIEKKSEEKWEIKEEKNNLKILIDILERNEINLIVKFYCEGCFEINFCQLPKINNQGNFIINGHDKVVIFQSVRAPSLYHFSHEDEENFYSEIIPLKGPWINISHNKKTKLIELKFLNTKLIVDFFDILKTFSLEQETLEKLFSSDFLNIENYKNSKKLEIGINMPQFLFVEKNSYFKLGKLGRKKINNKLNIFKKILGKKISQDFLDINDNIVFSKDKIIEEKDLQLLKKLIKEEKIKKIFIPHSTNELYSIKIYSQNDSKKEIFIVGYAESFSEEKEFLDLSDLISIVSSHINLYSGIEKVVDIEDKDKLDNQIIRSVGDLLYNKADVWAGEFVRDVKNKYLSYISQLKKIDFSKIPNLKEFERIIKIFFNTSVLVQLQNQNNPLAEISYAHKVSVMGFGGFSDRKNSATIEARNTNPTYLGKYDLTETPEGSKIGLIHNLTIDSKINEYGQIVSRYYVVKNGIITEKIVYLDSEEEWDKFITHSIISVNEKNEITEEYVPAIYQGKIITINKNRVDYIYSTFYHLNSPNTSSIPLFSHNDATRVLMTSNMQRQAVPLLINEEPIISSGIEYNLFLNSFLTVKTDFSGIVSYVDSEKIIIISKNKDKKIYKIRQLVTSNKNTLFFSFPKVKKGDKVEKNQIISCGNYSSNNEFALGHHFRVSYQSFEGFNYEDAVAIRHELVDKLTSFYFKKMTISRYNTKYGEEIFARSLKENDSFDYKGKLDKNGIIKKGSRVKGGDILVNKLIPKLVKENSAEEMLLLNILGNKAQKFDNFSLKMPITDEGIVYDIKRKVPNNKNNKNEIENLEIYVACKRRIEVGDKITTRFGNKGVIAKIISESDMPFDKEGKRIDIIFNPLGVPSRMNIGQLLEAILTTAAKKLNIKLLFRPFNSPTMEIIEEITKEAKIENLNGIKLYDGKTGLPIGKNKIIFVGDVYVLKLNHMVSDKKHTRNTGTRSSVYSQPLKGRSQGGGQRQGEMENWALQAHGAPYVGMELMGIKSDDINGRNELRNFLYGLADSNDRKIELRYNKSESFNILLQYLRGIGFDLRAFDKNQNEIDFYKYFNKK